MNPLLHRYESFFATPTIGDFLDSGGRVFIATEGRPPADIQALYALGHRTFAEKFVQEALRKFPLPFAPDVTLHYFGCLQTNKIARAVGLFTCIESVASERAADKLSDEILKSPDAPLKSVLVQINTGSEPQKKGVLPHQADALIQYCKDVQLPLEGLMAIPPRHDEPRPHFMQVRRLADSHGLEHCFMGMSNDFALAIECGATAIRVGRAIFSGLDADPATPPPHIGAAFNDHTGDA